MANHNVNASGTMSDGSAAENSFLDANANITSNDESIATVSGNIVSAIEAGVVTIQLEIQGLYVSLPITVESLDEVAPVISVDTTTITITEGDDLTLPIATATDETDGSITVTNDAATAVDTSTAGTYTVTFTATDAAGNVATTTLEVIVEAAYAYEFIGDESSITQNEVLAFTFDAGDVAGADRTFNIESEYSLGTVIPSEEMALIDVNAVLDHIRDNLYIVDSYFPDGFVSDLLLDKGDNISNYTSISGNTLTIDTAFLSVLAVYRDEAGKSSDTDVNIRYALYINGKYHDSPIINHVYI